MHLREHRGFTIQVYDSGAGYVSEIYRKGKLIHAVYHEIDPGSHFRSPVLVIEAAREDRPHLSFWKDKLLWRSIIKLSS
jgi:hypothetical protein